MRINNPIPRSLLSECRKATQILLSFVKPNSVLGQTEVIPPEVLRNAKGLAIITVLKAGFLFSGRAGSGVIVARLPDGTWLAPLAIMTAGAGVGGQIGAELTDFVFILNTQSAVDSFAQAGSITLGGNVSVALGPGRNAEAAATALLKLALAVFAYSKTKGVFAGVSLEGSAIAERRDANSKFYGERVKSRDILAGKVDPPVACDPLFRLLESRVFTRPDLYDNDDDLYGDIHSIGTGESPDERASWGDDRPRSAKRYAGSPRDDYSNSPRDSYGGDFRDDDVYGDRRSGLSRRATSHTLGWEDDVYDRAPRGPRAVDRSTKPSFGGRETATALYLFAGQQSGDLSFAKGDVIEIVKRGDSQDDWWTGRVNGKEGIFPANYVRVGGAEGSVKRSTTYA